MFSVACLDKENHLNNTSFWKFTVKKKEIYCKLLPQSDLKHQIIITYIVLACLSDHIINFEIFRDTYQVYKLSHFSCYFLYFIAH